MAQVQRGVDLVEDVHGCRFELQQRHDEGEGDQRALTARELRQRRLPDLAQAHFDFEAVGDAFVFGRVQFREGAREEFGEDGAEGGVHDRVRFPQRFFLVFVQALDRLFDLAFVADHGLHHALERRFFLLDAVDHVHHFGVDLFLQAGEAFGERPQHRFGLGDVEGRESVRRVGSAEEVSFRRDPVVR